MEFTKLLHRAALALFLFTHSAVAQVPGLLSYQGRVTVGGASFAGVGHFKFALVNADGTATFWSHDGTSTDGGEPTSAVTNLVASGLTTLLLGDTNLANMGPLSHMVFLNADVRLRIWFSDGTNGFARLLPDQQIAAVGYAAVAANVPDRTITLDKLADEVRTNLAARPPAGSVALSYDTQSTNLLNAGYVSLAGEVRQEEWNHQFLETSFDFGVVAGGLTNLWTGPKAWLWRWGTAAVPGQGISYDPVLNTWSPLSTNGAPALDRAQAAVTWAQIDLLVFGATPTGIIGARYHPSLDNWTAINTNNAPRLTGVFRYHTTATELFVLGDSPEGIRGGVYQSGSDTWQAIPTNGLPLVSLAGARLAGSGEGFMVIGNGATGLVGARYTWPANAWNSFNIPTNLVLSAQVKDTWNGVDWFFLMSGTPGMSGLRYRAVSDAWTNLPTAGAPVIQADSQLIWAGAELAVLTLSIQPAPGVTASAIYHSDTDRWSAVNRFGPSFVDAPAAEVFWTGSDLLVVRKGEPSKWALYNPATDRWRLLNGPTLGYDALNTWSGTSLISIVYQPPAGMEPMVYQYTPARALKLYVKP
jgi:hypothetical protein